MASPFGDSSAMATPFDSAFSPFGGAAAFDAPSDDDDDDDEEASGEPPEDDEHSDEDEGVHLGLDEGVHLGLAADSFSFKPRPLGRQATHEAEDALIEAALEAELGLAVSGGLDDDAGPFAAAARAGSGGFDAGPFAAASTAAGPIGDSFSDGGPFAAAARAGAAPPSEAGPKRQQLAPQPPRPALTVQRQHSLRDIGEFGGVTSIVELTGLLSGGGVAGASGAAVAPSAPQAVPAAGPAQQQQQRFGSPLPSVRGSGDVVAEGPGSSRQSGSAALAALGYLHAQQATQQIPADAQQAAAPAGPPALPPGGASQVWAQQHAAFVQQQTAAFVQQQQQQQAAGFAVPTPFSVSQQQLLRQGSPVPQPQVLRRASGSSSFEIGPAHIEVDERTGQVSWGPGAAWCGKGARTGASGAGQAALPQHSGAHVRCCVRLPPPPLVCRHSLCSRCGRPATPAWASRRSPRAAPAARCLARAPCWSWWRH